MARVVLNTILTELGHRADFVGTGEAAVDAVAAGGYDAVLMDVTLPGHRRLRGDAPHPRAAAAGRGGADRRRLRPRQCGGRGGRPRGRHGRLSGQAVEPERAGGGAPGAGRLRHCRQNQSAAPFGAALLFVLSVVDQLRATTTGFGPHL